MRPVMILVPALLSCMPSARADIAHEGIQRAREKISSHRRVVQNLSRHLISDDCIGETVDLMIDLGETMDSIYDVDLASMGEQVTCNDEVTSCDLLHTDMNREVDALCREAGGSTVQHSMDLCKDPDSRDGDMITLQNFPVCMGTSCDIDVSFIDVMEGAAEILEDSLNEKIEFEEMDSQSGCFNFYVEENDRIPGSSFFAAIFVPILAVLIAVLYKITYH